MKTIDDMEEQRWVDIARKGKQPMGIHGEKEQETAEPPWHFTTERKQLMAKRLLNGAVWICEYAVKQTFKVVIDSRAIEWVINTIQGEGVQEESDSMARLQITRICNEEKGGTNTQVQTFLDLLESKAITHADDGNLGTTIIQNREAENPTLALPASQPDLAFTTMTVVIDRRPTTTGDLIALMRGPKIE
ncbi:hypothetical protein Sjap_000375 [Stephania japonica]|uniref:Uncharacterized protein n=1 Tax=Stephania japonica TaxID=461633 RepID=A0AAP0KKH7_9MAGN